MASKKHAELIRAWLDGKEIQIKCDNGEWDWVKNPSWSEGMEYRIKPAEPEREPYPKCQMPEGAIRQMWVHALMNAESENQALRKFADGALQCERDAGQIFTRAEFDRAVGDRQKRDMDVAIAIGTVVQREMTRVRSEGGLCRWDFKEIIASVK